MRICLFTPTFFPTIGGVETWCDSFTRGMIARGHDVVVLAQVMRGGGPLPELPYPVTRYRRPPLQHLCTELLALHLLRLHRRHPFDIVVTNYGYPLGYVTSLVKKRLSLGHIAVAHGADLHEGFNPKGKRRIGRLTRLGYLRADRVAAVSTIMAQKVRDLLDTGPAPRRPPIDIIPNGIDLAAFERDLDAARAAPPELARQHGLLPGRFTFQVASLRPVKRPDVAVQAIARLRERYVREDLGT